MIQLGNAQTFSFFLVLRCEREGVHGILFLLERSQDVQRLSFLRDDFCSAIKNFIAVNKFLRRLKTLI